MRDRNRPWRPRRPATTGRFAFTGTSDRPVADVLVATWNDPEEHNDERMEATAWLIDYLTDHDGQAPATDVFKAGLASAWKGRVEGPKATSRPQSRQEMTGGWVWQLSTEESTKSAKGVGDETLHSSPLLAPFTP